MIGFIAHVSFNHAYRNIFRSVTCKVALVLPIYKMGIVIALVETVCSQNPLAKDVYRQ